MVEHHLREDSVDLHHAERARHLDASVLDLEVAVRRPHAALHLVDVDVERLGGVVVRRNPYLVAVEVALNRHVGAVRKRVLRDEVDVGAVVRGVDHVRRDETPRVRAAEEDGERIHRRRPVGIGQRLLVRRDLLLYRLRAVELVRAELPSEGVSVLLASAELERYLVHAEDVVAAVVVDERIRKRDENHRRRDRDRRCLRARAAQHLLLRREGYSVDGREDESVADPERQHRVRRDELHLLDEAVLQVALHVREKNQEKRHHEEARKRRYHPLPERLAVLLLDDPVARRKRNKRERYQKVGELDAHVVEIVNHLFAHEGKEFTNGIEVRDSNRLVLAALDRVLEALPSARIPPVHRRVAEVRDHRHVRIERDAELREERSTGDGTPVRERRPHEREKDEVPRDRPAEPPRARVGEAVHSAALQQHKRRDVKPRDRNRERKPLLRKRAKGEQHDKGNAEHCHRLAPRIDLSVIAEITRRGNVRRDSDGDKRADRGAHEIGERLALPDAPIVVLDDRSRHRKDNARRDERGDERVCARLYERRNRGRDPFPFRRAREDSRGEKHERRAKAAKRENRKTRLLAFAALLEDSGGDNCRDEEHDADYDDG